MRKIGLLIIALIIALGCSGVAYASWTNTLQAGGTVEVDDCWVEYCRAWSNDPGTTIDPGKPQHVASTEAKINQGYKRCWYWCFSRPNTLWITVTNGYPCYQSSVDFEVKAYAHYHCGHLESMKINGACVEPGKPVDLGDLVVTVSPPQTISPCQSGKGNMTIHVEQSAKQCSTYTFTVTTYYSFW